MALPTDDVHSFANANISESYPKGQFPVSGILRAGEILENQKLLSHNNLFNFRATFSLVNNRISARSENSTDWKFQYLLIAKTTG